MIFLVPVQTPRACAGGNSLALKEEFIVVLPVAPCSIEHADPPDFSVVFTSWMKSSRPLGLSATGLQVWRCRSRAHRDDGSIFIEFAT